MNQQAQNKRKYLSTSEMVTGIRKKTNDPIPHVSLPGDYRVYRPTKHDVLCGRGKPIQDHVGNLRMRSIIASNANRYFHARKHKKQQIVEEVVDLVKCSGGVQARFLKRVGRENYWVEVPNSVACDKVSHGLRCFVRKSELSEFPESQNEEQSHTGEDSSDNVRSSSPASSTALHDSMSTEGYLNNPADRILSKLMAHRMGTARLAAEPSAPFPTGLTSATLPLPSLNPSGTTAFLPTLALSHGTPSHNLTNAQLVEFLARERISREVVRPEMRDLRRGQQDHPQLDQIRMQELIKQQAALQPGTNEMLMSQMFQQQRQEDAQKVTLAFLLAAAMGGVVR